LTGRRGREGDGGQGRGGGRRRGVRWLLLALLAGALAGALVVARDAALNRPLPVGEEPVDFEVRPGQGLHEVAAGLARRGLLPGQHFLVVEGRWTGKAARIHVGEYRIRPGMSALDLLEMMVTGRVLQRSLTLVEGWTFAQMIEEVRASPYLRHTLEGLGPKEIMARLGLPGEYPEGRFYPDTYHFPRGTRDVDFLDRARRAMDRALETEWEGRAENLPYRTPYEALIMASLVEKETGHAPERERVAGVLVRRLVEGMRLQTDPTVIYGLGEDYDGRLRRADLRRDTPYNTYVHRGLPPTPIAMPGRASLRAALHPAIGDDLFFVSRGDGSHHFSPTYAEHRRAVARYILGQGSGSTP
jgi:UPF0755 protein